MAERCVFSIFLLHFQDIPLDKAVQLREDLIATGLEAGLIEIEDIRDTWLFIEPSHRVPNASAENKNKEERINFVGGECMLVRVAPDWSRKVAEGIIGIGPGGEIICKETAPPIIYPKKEAGDFHFATKFIKSGNSFSPPRHFASFYINAAWTDEELRDKTYELCQFLFHSGFLPFSDLSNIRTVATRVAGAKQSLILIFLDSHPFGQDFLSDDFPSEEESKSETEEPDESTEFNPDILKEALKRRPPDGKK